MKIKVVTTNEHGKVELTKAELETLLEDSYREGYMEAVKMTPITFPFLNPTIPLNTRNLKEYEYSNGLKNTYKESRTTILPETNPSVGVSPFDELKKEVRRV